MRQINRVNMHSGYRKFLDYPRFQISRVKTVGLAVVNYKEKINLLAELKITYRINRVLLYIEYSQIT